MKLNFVVPDMAKTFGTLTFAGVGDTVSQRAGNGRRVVSQTFNLYSSVQRADNIEVTIPGKVGTKMFEFDSKVKLINPRITVTGYAINSKGFVNYHLIADDIVAAEESK